jgi:hypothetical protein
LLVIFSGLGSEQGANSLSTAMTFCNDPKSRIFEEPRPGPLYCGS